MMFRSTKSTINPSVSLGMNQQKPIVWGPVLQVLRNDISYCSSTSVTMILEICLKPAPTSWMLPHSNTSGHYWGFHDMSPATGVVRATFLAPEAPGKQWKPR